MGRSPAPPLDLATALNFGKYEGPTLRVEARCSDCRHLRIMRAASSFNGPWHYCTHESAPPEGRLLDGVRTPRDCPLWDVGAERLRKRESRSHIAKKRG